MAHPGGAPIQWTDEKLDAFGKEMVEFCQLEGVYRMCDFATHKKGSPSWLCQLVKEHPKLSEFYKWSKEILGSKLVAKSVDGSVSNWTLATLGPMYMQDVRDFEEKKKDKATERDISKSCRVAEFIKNLDKDQKIEFSGSLADLLDRFKDIPLKKEEK